MNSKMSDLRFLIQRSRSVEAHKSGGKQVFKRRYCLNFKEER